MRESFPDFTTASHKRSIWFSYTSMRTSLQFITCFPPYFPPSSTRAVGRATVSTASQNSLRVLACVTTCVVVSFIMVAAIAAPPTQFPPPVPVVQRPTTHSPGQLPSSISATQVSAKKLNKNLGSDPTATSATRVAVTNRWLVTFTFTPSLGTPKQVSLAGDFNNWNKLAAPMRRAIDGSWSTSVELPEGIHLYKFVVDNQTWLTDQKYRRSSRRQRRK